MTRMSECSPRHSLAHGIPAGKKHYRLYSQGWLRWTSLEVLPLFSNQQQVAVPKETSENVKFRVDIHERLKNPECPDAGFPLSTIRVKKSKLPSGAFPALCTQIPPLQKWLTLVTNCRQPSRGLPPAEQPEPDCVSPAGAALQAPVSAAPIPRPSTSTRASSRVR